MVLEGTGGARAGEDLRSLIDHARRFRTLMGYAPKRYDPAVIEALALTGALDPNLSTDAKAVALTEAAAWQGRADLEASWSGEIAVDGGYHFRRLWRGVTDHYIIDAGFLASTEARKLHALATEQRDSYAGTARLVTIKASEKATDGEDDDAPALDPRGVLVTRPSQLLDAILAAGRKGLAIARYKGLGEMNAEQLWETTLDPSNRSLLKVEVEQADVADEIFTRLMGDVVEPRREFIQENALSVANLDV